MTFLLLIKKKLKKSDVTQNTTGKARHILMVFSGHFGSEYSEKLYQKQSVRQDHISESSHKIQKSICNYEQAFHSWVIFQHHAMTIRKVHFTELHPSSIT